MPKRQRDKEDQNVVYALAPRQRDCLLWIARGLTIKEGAQKMGVTPKTFQMISDQVYTNLKARGKSLAVYVALKLGLINIDEILEYEHPIFKQLKFSESVMNIMEKEGKVIKKHKIDHFDAPAPIERKHKYKRPLTKFKRSLAKN